MKKLIILAILAVLFLFATASVQAENIIYGGGKLIVPGGTTDKVGFATQIGYGQQVGNMIIWLPEWEGVKTGEGLNIDNVLIGTTFLTDPFIPLPFVSKYLGLSITIKEGAGKIPDKPVGIAGATGLGVYCNISTRSTVWVDYEYSIVRDVATHGFSFGFSFYPE